MAPLLWVLLAADPFAGGSRWVHEAAGWTRADLLCESRTELRYRVGEELRGLEVATGAATLKLSLKKLPEGEGDCATGHCFFRQELTSADGARVFDYDGRVVTYYGEWAYEATLRERGAKPPRTAVCPGGRPLQWCFTARRTVRVQLSGDRNVEDSPLLADYVASDLEASPKETLHLSHGKVKAAKGTLESTFSNKGFTYRLTTGTDPAAPSAQLVVEKGGKVLQTEPCVAYAAFPDGVKQLP